MIFLIKQLSRLPLGLLYAVSDILAFIANHLVGYRRAVVLENLRKSFPDKNEKEIKKIAGKFYSNLADLVVETLKGITISQDEIKKRVKFENLEMMDHFLEEKQSVFLITIHQCNWEWLLLSGCSQFPFPIDVLYLQLNNPKMDKMMYEARSRFGGKPIKTHNSLMEIMKRSKEIRAFGMVADQVPPRGSDKYWTTFLNQDTAFLLGTEQLPKLLKYPVVFLSMERVHRGYYQVRLEQIAAPPYSKDKHEIIESYVQKAEQVVLENPSDWLWSHRRWKYKRGLYE